MNKKLFSLTLIFTLLATIAFAQEINRSKISFGIIGGVNFQNFNGKDLTGNTLKNDMIVGYHAGVNAQIPIAQQFYFQPGLMFSAKGSKNVNSLLTSTYKLSYLELPLNFVYKAGLGSGYFMLGFGPYMAYAIGGKATFEGGPIKVTSDIIFKEGTVGDPTYFKPFDAGANIFFGYELSSGLFAQLNTQLGMLNIQPGDNKSSIKNSGFGLSLGYRF